MVNMIQWWNELCWPMQVTGDIDRAGISWAELTMDFLQNRRMSIPTRHPYSEERSFQPNLYRLKQSGVGFFHVVKNFSTQCHGSTEGWAAHCWRGYDAQKWPAYSGRAVRMSIMAWCHVQSSHINKLSFRQSLDIGDNQPYDGRVFKTGRGKTIFGFLCKRSIEQSPIG